MGRSPSRSTFLHRTSLIPERWRTQGPSFIPINRFFDFHHSSSEVVEWDHCVCLWTPARLTSKWWIRATSLFSWQTFSLLSAQTSSLRCSRFHLQLFSLASRWQPVDFQRKCCNKTSPFHAVSPSQCPSFQWKSLQGQTLTRTTEDKNRPKPITFSFNIISIFLNKVCVSSKMEPCEATVKTIVRLRFCWVMKNKCLLTCIGKYLIYLLIFY